MIVRIFEKLNAVPLGICTEMITGLLRHQLGMKIGVYNFSFRTTRDFA
jgi:hypothetical protein